MTPSHDDSRIERESLEMAEKILHEHDKDRLGMTLDGRIALALMSADARGYARGRAEEREQWCDFIRDAAAHGFQDWWDEEAENEASPEPWETFRLMLYGREAGDTMEEVEASGHLIRAYERHQAIRAEQAIRAAARAHGAEKEEE